MLRNAVVLAGGKSSRMGEDKALLPAGGFNSMAEYQYARLKKIFSNVYISTKMDKFDFKADMILDNSSDIYSPMVALKSILNRLDEDFFLLSVDMPLLSLDSIEKLIDIYSQEKKYDIYAFKSSNGLEPTAAIYTTKTLPIIDNLLSKNCHKLQSLLSNVSLKNLFLEKNYEFINVNTKEEYSFICEQLKC